MHLDLVLGEPEKVFTNPAAALGGTATMYLVCDFGQCVVRVATFSFKTEKWTVQSYQVNPNSAALPIALPADVNKVGVSVSQGDAQWPVGVDVLV